MIIPVSTSAAVKPLCKAKWLWPEGSMYLYNCFAHFRHDFELEAVPESAPLFITADQAYRLHINGQYVCRGPARGYQSHWPYDEIDVREWLRTGHNWIAVEAYNPGISTFQYIHQSRAGFICAAEWDDIKIYSSLDTWQMRRAHNYRNDVARLSWQMGFQEDATVIASDRDWISSSIPPVWGTTWPLCSECYPFGQPPYDSVEPRGIPMLRENPLVPAGISSHGIGLCANGYKDCKNPAWHWIGQEFPKVIEWDDGKEIILALTDDSLMIRVEPSGEGLFRVITVDLGEISLGSLNVKVENAIGNEILDFHYVQCLRNGIPDMVKVGDGCHLALANRMRLAKGECYHEFFQLFGCKHIVIVARDITQPITLKLSWRTAEYPFTMHGRFQCSDETLNEIHRCCRKTQQLCAYDAYVDTPWREQAQWWGDARVQIRNTVFLDGDMRLVARGIRSIAGQDAPYGLTCGHAPTSNGGCILPDFSLTWILTIWDYYWQTGDLMLFHEQHDRIKQIFNYFAMPEVRNSEKLLIYDPRFWLFEDWADLSKEGAPTFLNLLHLYTLQHYHRLLLAAGEIDSAATVKEKITYRSSLLDHHFFDSGQELFICGLNENHSSTGTPSVHDQVLAVLCGLRRESWPTMLDKRLLPFIRNENVEGATPSAFWSTYLFEVLVLLGYGTEVVDFIRTTWSPMISTGTVWEEFKWTESASQSCCHAWSAHPSSHLVEILLGLRQAAPNWRKVTWRPIFPDGMDCASALIPTPQGDLSASWQRDSDKIRYDINIPAGMTVEAELSGQPTCLLNTGRHCIKILHQPLVVV